MHWHLSAGPHRSHESHTWTDGDMAYGVSEIRAGRVSFVRIESSS